MDIFVGIIKVPCPRLKSIRGVGNLKGGFHEITRNIIKLHENEEVSRNFHKLREIHKIYDFCVTETHESAKSTKQYELPLQIGEF